VKTVVLSLLAETSIHPGSGRGVGVVDLPVSREAATDYPVLVGSSLKGALRDRTEWPGEAGRQLAERRFGKVDRAGDLLVSDGRLLLLPVRSLTGASQWVTCPQLLERFRRDVARAHQPDLAAPEVGPAPENDHARAFGGDELFLEERQFIVDGPPNPALIETLQRAIPHPEVRKRLAGRLVIVSDGDFAWFARYGLPITARNQLNNDTKQSLNLWYEETLPPDTVMYALVMGRTEDALGTLADLFPAHDRYLQVGGNETVGHGWFAVGFPAKEEAAVQ
jgi:CRISPR-associated protein Cmr4